MNRKLPNECSFSNSNLRVASETAKPCGVIPTIYICNIYHIISICEYHTCNTCTYTCEHIEFAPRAFKGTTQEK